MSNNKRKRKATTKSKDEFYLNNEELMKQLTLSKINNQPTELLHEYFLLLAKNICKKPNFINYTYNEDMVMNGYMRAIRVWDKFDIETKSNPFAYFTSVIWNEVVATIKKENKHLKLLQAVAEKQRSDMYTETGIDILLPSFYEESDNE